jgi:hypothetical protein
MGRAGEELGKGRIIFTVKVDAAENAAHRATAVYIGIDKAGPGLGGKLFYWSGQDDMPVGCAGRAELKEGRQDRCAAGAPQGRFERRVVSRIGCLAEVDIKGDLAGASRRQAIEQLPMQTPRPRPDADVFKTFGVDLDDDDIAADRALVDAEPIGVEEAVKGDDKAAQERNGKEGENRKRRLDPRHFRPSPGFLSPERPVPGAGLAGRHGVGAMGTSTPVM